LQHVKDWNTPQTGSHSLYKTDHCPGTASLPDIFHDFAAMSPYCGTHVKHTLITVPPHIHPINGPFSGTTWVSRYQKDKTNLDFTEARDIEWQWHQLGHMPCSRQITTPAPHHSVLYRPEALPAAFPIRSKQRDICYYVNAEWQMSKDQF